MDSILKEYILGDMVARYCMDEKKHVGLQLYPRDMPIPEMLKKNAKLDGMVQLKISGDIYQGSYAPGNTLRNGESTERLLFEDQKEVLIENSQTIITTLRDKRGYEVRHTLYWQQGSKSVEIWNELKNSSKTPVSIEMLSSFSLTGISPYIEGDGHNNILVHRLMSRWS